MHTPRITNASLFATVVSACLGLMITGVTTAAHAQTQQGIATAVSKSQALLASAASQQLSPQQARKLAATSGSYFQLAVLPSMWQTAQPFYQNSRALTDKNQFLLVTRLPRAGLLRSLAE